MQHPVIHFEVISDGDHSKFYESVFGWQSNRDNPMGYGTVSAEQGGISGGLGQPYDGETESYATFYVAVSDIDAVLTRVEAAGGSIALEKREFFPGGPVIAQLKDPAGVRVGLLQQPAAS